MFYPEVMNKVFVGVHQSGYQAFLSGLQEEGIVEITDIKEVEDSSLQFSTCPTDHTTLNRVIRNQLKIDHLLEIVHLFHWSDEGIIATWFTPPKNEGITGYLGDAATICQYAEIMEEDLQCISQKYTDYSDIEEKISNITTLKGTLHNLLAFDLNLEDITSTPFTEVVAGLVATDDIALFMDRIRLVSTTYLHVETKMVGDEYLIGIITTAGCKDALMDAIRTPLFRRIIPPKDLHGRPSELISVFQQDIINLKAEKDQIIAELTTLARAWQPRLSAMHEDLSFLRERLETARKCGATQEVIGIEGWIAACDIPKLQQVITRTVGSEGFIHVREPDPSEQVPVKYNNPSWIRPFEFLTTMFAPPRYGEIDPTPFFAPAFLLFFGLMLGDAGYGIIILLVAYLFYRGAGQRDQNFGNMCIVLMGCGVVDIICGALQGGWFGDILPRFFGIVPPFILIEPLKTPIQFFQLALIIGNIHINIGIFLGFLQSYKKKHYRQAWGNHLIWYVIQPAAAILLIQFFGWMTFPGWISQLAGALLVITFGMLFLSNGPMGFFSITGFLGDWLSYVRILALALATGGIAMTINLLAEMIAGAHPLLLIPAILFLIIGQTFNLVIQALGSAIHALRLHYIEFFGKFYTGGGRLFSPFATHRVYTMKEKNEVI
jgi:V/A-type H+-transporting ATPase subunit I